MFIVKNNNFHMSDSLRKTNSILSRDGFVNGWLIVEGYVNIKDLASATAPDFTPPDISAVFAEGATCVSVQCWNAAAAMFRAAIDLATKKLLPPEGEEPNTKVRRSLGLRLDWMFKNGALPTDLEALADVVQHDGNDGAHDANLTQAEAYDLQDFTQQLLTRLYTTPGRIQEAQERRAVRREALKAKSD